MFINLGIANYQVHRIYLGIAKLPGAPVIIYFSAAQVRFWFKQEFWNTRFFFLFFFVLFFFVCVLSLVLETNTLDKKLMFPTWYRTHTLLCTLKPLTSNKSILSTFPLQLLMYSRYSLSWISPQKCLRWKLWIDHVIGATVIFPCHLDGMISCHPFIKTVRVHMENVERWFTKNDPIGKGKTYSTGLSYASTVMSNRKKKYV